MEEAGTLHCLSSGVFSGDEAALGRGESGEGGTAIPCKSPRSGQGRCA